MQVVWTEWRGDFASVVGRGQAYLFKDPSPGYFDWSRDMSDMWGNLITVEKQYFPKSSNSALWWEFAPYFGALHGFPSTQKREDDTEEMQQRSEFYIAHVTLGNPWFPDSVSCFALELDEKPQVNHQVPCRKSVQISMLGSLSTEKIIG